MVGLAPERLDYAHLDKAFRICACFSSSSCVTRRAVRAHLNASARDSIEGASRGWLCFSRKGCAKISHRHRSSPPVALLTTLRLTPSLSNLISQHEAMYYRPSGISSPLSLGPGAFVHGLSVASSLPARVVGKPSRAFFELTLSTLGMRVGEGDVGIVGDDVKNDLGGGAVELGLKRFLGQPISFAYLRLGTSS